MAKDRGRIAAISALALGAGILLISGFLAMRGDSAGKPDPGVANPDAFMPYEDTPVEDELEVERSEPAPTAVPNARQVDLVPDGQFGPASGDTGPHKVTITIQSDGAIYVGYRFWKAGEGLKFADKSFRITRTVNRGRAVAQVGAQVLDTATYATCTISVDGVVVTTHTAKKKFGVAVCAA